MIKLIASLVLVFSVQAIAQSTPIYEVDASWPKPLPEGWINGQLGGSCIDSHDHIAVVDRRNITEEEMDTMRATPPILFFDIDGNLSDSFGDPDVVPASIHGCAFDAENNIYVAGNADGIIQKYSHEGELLLQIGTRGAFDTSDGTYTGAAQNSSKVQLYRPAGMAVDPDNGDIYIADGYGNRRVVVFDKEGNYLRQWGRQATVAETRAGEGGAFAQVVHCVVMSNEGLVYVCDRMGDRIQVFSKEGDFVRNIWVRTGTADLPDTRGTAWSIEFSADPRQQYLYVVDGRNEQVHVLDHQSGEILSTFGRPGHYAGNFNHGHTVSVDSQGGVYIAETGTGRRIQRFIRADED